MAGRLLTDATQFLSHEHPTTCHGGPTTPERQRVVAGYVSRGQGAGPLLVTKRAGLFEQMGLDVEISLLEGSRRQSAALMSNELLFGNMAAAGLLPAAIEGADLVFVTGGINQQFLVGRPGVSTLADISGGSIAVHRTGELPDLLARVVNAHMESLGLDPLERVMIEDSGESADRLIAGGIDAIPLSPPAANEARRQGCSFILDFSDFGLNYTLGGIATRRRTISEQPDIVRRFVRAYVAGMHRYKSDRHLAVDVQQEYSKIADRSIAEETYETTEPGMPRAPYPVTSGLETLLATYRQVEPRAESLTVDSLVDPRFVAELDEAGFIKELYA